METKLTRIAEVATKKYSLPRVKIYMRIFDYGMGSSYLGK